MTTVYPFVQAAFDKYGSMPTAPLAIGVHVAEGGGTVGYLSRDPKRGVSVHFVIERSGRTVQMLKLDRISGSINPKLLRTSDDPPFVGYNGEVIVFGVSAVRAVLGRWARNPNAVLITVELEGTAAAGPNPAQRKAVVLLSRDLRKRLPTLRGNLGHRDFAAYKRCPGKLIPFSNMGGHGLYHP